MTSRPRTLVLLHGLNRSRRSMTGLQRAFAHDDVEVLNLDYPSSKGSVAQLTTWVHGRLHEHCPHALAQGVDFITHSLGGIIVRALRVQYPAIAIGRVAMLSPPNQGTEVVDGLRRWALFRFIAGPAGQQLGTEQASVPCSLGPVDFELGVVAGNVSMNPLYSWLIPGENDGTVAVERMRVEGMRDFITVSAGHALIMHNAEAIRQARHFILNGCFAHPR